MFIPCIQPAVLSATASSAAAILALCIESPTPLIAQIMADLAYKGLTADHGICTREYAARVRAARFDNSTWLSGNRWNDDAIGNGLQLGNAAASQLTRAYRGSSIGIV